MPEVKTPHPIEVIVANEYGHVTYDYPEPEIVNTFSGPVSVECETFAHTSSLFGHCGFDIKKGERYRVTIERIDS